MSEQPYFGDDSPAPGAKRRGRPPGSRSKARPVADTNPAEETSTQPAPKVEEPTGVPVRSRRKAAATARKPPALSMTADQYAQVFQALHGIPAGLLGIPELAVTSAEADMIGGHLQTCAEYYGWDFMEKLGPAFMLCLTAGALEVKVAKRVFDGAPARKDASQRAKRAKQGPVAEQPRPMSEVDSDPQPVPASTGNDAADLEMLRKVMADVPEDGLVPIL